MMPADREVNAVEEQAIASFMERLRAAPLAASPRRVGADVLYVKARLVRQWEAERRIRRPIELMEPFELAAGLAAAVLLLAWSVPSAFEWWPRLAF
jgi:hypothetical protein